MEVKVRIESTQLMNFFYRDLFYWILSGILIRISSPTQPFFFPRKLINIKKIGSKKVAL